jgi:hypothetical protein
MGVTMTMMLDCHTGRTKATTAAFIDIISQEFHFTFEVGDSNRSSQETASNCKKQSSG